MTPKVKRRVYSVADQGVSSLSNLVLAVFIAQQASVDEFGLYAIVASVYWLSLGSTRALIGEAFLVLGHELSATDDRVAHKALGLAIVLGAAIGTCVLGVGAAFGIRPLMVLGVCMPALLWQDALRYVFFGREGVHLALLADGVWLAVLAVAGAVLLSSSGADLPTWLAIWGGGALLGGVAATIASGLWPTVTGSFALFNRARKTSSELFAEFMLGSGTSQAILFLLPLLGGLAILAALKSAQVAMGPFNVAVTAANLVALPGVARIYATGDLGLVRRRGLILAGIVSGCGLVYTGLLVLTPHSWGEAFFGASWTEGIKIAGLVGVQMSILGAAQGAVVVLRGTQNTRASLNMRFWITPPAIALPLGGAAIGGIPGLGAGMIVSAVIGVSLWWSAAIRVTRPTAEGVPVASPSREPLPD